MDVSPNKKPPTVLATVLKAFIPYSKESIMLGFSPNRFFNYLEYIERLSKYTGSSKQSIRATISRAKRRGLMARDDKGRLKTTWRGNVKAGIMPRDKTKKSLVIVFDIPESLRSKRDLLRAYLRAMHCEVVQRSVWKTKYDIYDELQDALDELDLHSYVAVFLADEVSLTKTPF